MNKKTLEKVQKMMLEIYQMNKEYSDMLPQMLAI